MMAVESPDRGAGKKQRGQIKTSVIGQNYARHFLATRLTVRHFEQKQKTCTNSSANGSAQKRLGALGQC